MRIKIICVVFFFAAMQLPFILKAQLFSPVVINGFNQDVIAESGTSALTTTTMALDAVPASNKVMYTLAFRTANGFGGGGIPDNGTITDAAGTYQLAAYNGNNAFLIQRSQNRDINITTPAQYRNIRILAFSTEGTSLLNINLFFTDGSQTAALTNYSLSDWFNATTNLVVSGIGRCSRTTPAVGADGYPTNPRLYYIDIPISCANSSKLLQKINVANATTAGTNAPYPNTVILAVSGKTYAAPSVTASVTNANCTVNGSATLNITGGASPFTVSWNTSPVQTGLTATNLLQGNYTATLTDANTCTSTFSVSINLTNNLTMSTRLDTSICSGASFTPNIVSNASNFTWSPANGVSNINAANPVLNPSTTTTYTVNGTLGTNCSINRSFTVNVAQAVTVDAGNDVTILSGSSTQLSGSGFVGSYLWSPAAGLSSTSILNPVAAPAVTTRYTLRITTTAGCTNTDSVLLTVVPYCIKALGAFSPNGDGINDVWKVYDGINCTRQIAVKVYNRYGGLIYENENYQNNWNGTYKGKNIADGTYYYIMEIILINNQKVLLKGDVTVLR
jgi:gliding motility-associated-like protein